MENQKVSLSPLAKQILDLPTEAKSLLAELMLDVEKDAYKRGFSEGYNLGFTEHKHLPF